MTKEEFLKILGDLDITQVEAAQLLSVNIRTIRRWAEDPNEITGPAKQALLAWRRLRQIGMPWRSDSADPVALYRNHAIDLDALLKRVEARGGPVAPWHVDLDKHIATLGRMEVGFYRLPNGGFSPSFYRRTDREPNFSDDQVFLDDAYACITQAIADQNKEKGSM